MRAYWADLFCVPMADAVRRLERLAEREIAHLARLDPDAAERHGQLVAEVIQEAAWLERVVTRAGAQSADTAPAAAPGTPRPSPSS